LIHREEGIMIVDERKINPIVKARRTLRAAISGYVELSPGEWYDLTLQATGDESLAEMAYNRAAAKLLGHRGE
jgi:hypothetical protein